MSTWAVDRHVAQGILRVLATRHGVEEGWRRGRVLWLSGAVDSRLPIRCDIARQPIHPGAAVYRADPEIWD